MPPIPITDTRCARASSALAWNRSLINRISRSRPTNGDSRPTERSSPPRSAITRTARASSIGSALPFSRCIPVSSYTIAALLARRVTSVTNTVPGIAAVWTARCGVHEVSCNANPWPSAASVTAVSPVATPARAAGSRPNVGPECRHRIDQLEPGSDGALRVVLLSDRRAPDRHHRIADELLDRSAVSLDELRAVSKYLDKSSRTSSGSRSSDSAVNPTRSAKSTETSFRSETGAGRAPGTKSPRGGRSRIRRRTDHRDRSRRRTEGTHATRERRTRSRTCAPRFSVPQLEQVMDAPPRRRAYPSTSPSTSC